ncbi:hypothetical protein SAMN02745704_02110 [Paucidesulfovibrio gracilis DSM 16080]|uniref:Uncharacterized protein n=1 Tax=Paucidesulfovibrio gracilis DSM 16080 TaxID=1121449 RepID=A0A1T4XG28_9BACT|nr:hypothetical protein [Paucidesulfovibrio gracilis]SKA88347.1 hypothetical protein SAMN02745704_02110 [Paucidesulfovibrio gracilis DSM 16080]
MCALTINSNTGYGVYNTGFGLNGTKSGSGRDVASLNTRELREQIDKILEGVPKSGSKLSFQDVMDYRDKLREEFESIAKEELGALGVDTERDFTLSYDAATDKVTVDPEHPDKEIIDRYFEETPEMREAFAKIVSLSKLSGAAEKTLSPTQFRQQMQAQAMSWWAEENGNMGWFSGGGMMNAEAGLQLFGGVNMQV